MKTRLLAFALSLTLCTATVFAQSATPAATPATASNPSDELKALVTKIGAKLQAGQRSPEALAAELKEFDALEAKYGGQKNDEVASIPYMRAVLHLQVFDDVETATKLLTQLVANYPGTKAAGGARAALEAIERQAAAQAAGAALVGKPAPELNFTWATREGLEKLSDLEGKVVVLDFWATWCGPCVASFPNVRELTAHYEGLDVVVVGVTSLQGRVHGLQASPIDTRNDPKKEHALMADYIKAKDITWTVAFSEEEVFNPDYGVQGIPHMVIVAPDGTVRHSALHPGGPLADKVAKIDALLKEFGKPTKPAAN